MPMSYNLPGVYPVLEDRSTVVKGDSTSVAAIVGAAEFGPIDKRVLISDSRNYMDVFGKPNAKYSYIGYCALNYLEEGNELHVTRVVGSGALMSSIKVNKSDSITVTNEIVGTSDADDVTFAKIIDHVGLGIVHNSVAVTVEGQAGTNGTDNGSGVISGTGITAGTINYATGAVSVTLAVTPGNTKKVFITYSYTAAVTSASGGLSKTAILGNLFSADTEAAILVRAENPGVWGNKLKLQITDINETDETFTINIYKVIDGIDVLAESYPGLSRDPSAIDGYNKTIYHVNVLSKSSLVRSYDNTSVTGLPSEIETPVLLTGAADGAAPTESDVSAGWDLYENPDDIQIDLLLNGGYVTSSTFGVQTKMKAIAETRRDCRAILDAPYSELAMSPTTDLTDWRNTVQNFNSYFTSLDAPWITIIDNINGGIRLDIPTSGFTAQVMARKDNIREPWNAAAGTQLTGNIGVISSSYFSIVGLAVNYSPTQQGLLYKANINPYRNKPGFGIVRWGQKTQQTKASALDRENVVVLSIIIENSAKTYLDNIVFELNTRTVRSDISETLQLFMGNIQARGGLYAFQVICDETNNTPTVIDNNELIVDIIYQPVKTAEFIRLRGTITKTGAAITAGQ